MSQQKQIINLNQQKMRNSTIDSTHGSPYDRGSADSYYGRKRFPHKWPEGTGHGEMVILTDAKEIEEYLLGYEENQDFKEW